MLLCVVCLLAVADRYRSRIIEVPYVTVISGGDGFSSGAGGATRATFSPVREAHCGTLGGGGRQVRRQQCAVCGGQRGGRLQRGGGRMRRTHASDVLGVLLRGTGCNKELFQFTLDVEMLC